jgi:hypothetical protein
MAAVCGVAEFFISRPSWRRVGIRTQKNTYHHSLPSHSSSQLLNSLPLNHDMISSTIPPEASSLPKVAFFSVAPMMGYTNRHQRKLMRLITKSAVLYTEMVVASTLIHTKNLHQHLGADFENENPLVLQLGGSDPRQLAEAAEIAKRYGYQRINLNVGCPSERVAGSSLLPSVFLTLSFL